MRRWVPLLVSVLTACGGGSPPVGTRASAPPATTVAITVPSPTVATTVVSTTTVPTIPVAGADPDTAHPVIRIVLAGDVMLGRGVAGVVAGDPDSVFAGIADAVGSADIAAANLESPLTTRPHLATNPYALEGRPQSADLLADVGFDLVNLANNHAQDAGNAGLVDTIEAVEAAGLAHVGAGRDRAEATATTTITAGGITVAFLAFDLTGAVSPAGDARAGVSVWDPVVAKEAVGGAARHADLVVVSIHGGVEYTTAPVPAIDRVAADLVSWGADVVWGHHPHVVQPVYAVDGSVVATSLGNLLFDQLGAATNRGYLLEVATDGDGVFAYRVATTVIDARRVRLTEWETPSPDSVFYDDAWWTSVRPGSPLPLRLPAPVGIDAG